MLKRVTIRLLLGLCNFGLAMFYTLIDLIFSMGWRGEVKLIKVQEFS